MFVFLVVNDCLFRQILAFRIKEHIAPAKVGTGCLEFKLPAGS